MARAGSALAGCVMTALRLAVADYLRLRRSLGFGLVRHEKLQHQFVDWLAESDLNAYLYDETDQGRGIASTTDHALAARRPIALTRTWMFRHLHECQGIFVESSTLSEIMARGIEPLRSAYAEFSDEAKEAMQVHVVESGLDFVHDIKR